MYIEQEVLRLNSIITELCRKNPEICPHDYQWDYTDAPKDGKRKNGINVVYVEKWIMNT